ncbi:putative E3 ubiquitin-protein ligase RING1b [Vigna angularis]|nr:putative E3 ubiquitin-protein ligase RING1b [Vigna angularis]
MKNKRNKQNLRRNAPKGLTSQLGIEDDDEVLYPLDLADLRKDVECPICLGIIRNTRMVMECMHRFCKECIEKSFRLGNNECPACRTHCSSRRSLREDIVFDEVIAVVFPNIDEYEKKEIAFSDDAKNNIKSMQEAYGQTLERQNEALRKKAAAAAASGSKDKYSRSGTQTLRRSARNESAFSESSSSRDMTLPPIAEERETQVIPVRDFADLQIQPQSSQHETNARTVAGGTIQSLIASSDKLVWGRFGPRSHTNSNARHAAALRSNRLERFIDHLQNSNQNDDELDIYIKLVSFEEERVTNLARPYLNCRPTLSIDQLCQYVAIETLLQTEEIELYVVKGCEPGFVSGREKFVADKYETQFLERGDKTLAEIIPNNLSLGHLVLAYKRKKWNLNEVLSCSGSE